MASDADRFRPRDARPESEQHQGERAQRSAPTGYAERTGAWPRREQSSDAGAQRYAPPRYAAPQPAPQQTVQRYAPPRQHAFDGADAPLIHPAAAQASNAMPYGMPVYRAPTYVPVAPPARGLSITAFVLGLCSLVFAWLVVVVPVLGIAFGLVALKREPAGRVLAVIGTVASAVGLLFVLLFYVLPFGAFFGAMLFGSLL